MPQDIPSYALPGPYTTQLNPAEETEFQGWVKQNNIPWQDDPKADYDMRGFWKAQKTGDPLAKRATNLHFPDTYKTPYHKTFSNESKYATKDAPHWEGDKLVSKDGRVMADESPNQNPLGSVPGNQQPPLPNLPPPPNVAPQQAPAPTPAQQMSQQLQTADTAHHSALGKAFRSIMGNDVSYQINPQTGKMEQTETPQKPGQFWRGIIAATVLGGATAARSKAPGFIQGAAEGGEAVVDKSQQQDLLKRQQAQEQFKDQLAARSANTEEDLKRAQIAMHNAHTLHENQIMQREDYSFHKDVADHGKSQLQPFINADPTLVKFQDIPETKMTDLLKNNPDSQHLLWEPTGTRVVIGADGKPNVEATYSGVDPKGNVKVTTDQIDQWKKAGLDQIYGKATWDVLTKDKELPANTYMAINQKAQELTNKQLIDKKTKLDAEKEQTAIDLAKAQTKHFNAEAGKLWAEEKDKKMATEAFDILSTGGDVSKISIKGRKLLIDGLDSIIKTNVDELKALPKDPTTNQPVDQDRAKELYGTMENYQKIVDRLYGVKPTEKPAAGGAGAASLSPIGRQYVSTHFAQMKEGEPLVPLKGDEKDAGEELWDDPSVPPDQKLAITKQTGLVMPWRAVQAFSGKVGIKPEEGAKQLTAAGFKVGEKTKEVESQTPPSFETMQ